MRGEETDAYGEALTSRKGKTDYGAQNTQGIQTKIWKNEPSNDCV